MGRVKDEFITGRVPEEGDPCDDEDCRGHLIVAPGPDCSCHISPPCSSCIEHGLMCNFCGMRP